MSDSLQSAYGDLLEALSFAARAHQGQTRKDGRTPYVAHVFRVCLVVRHVFGIDDPRALMAAALHDAIEDTPTDFDDLAETFGPEVAQWAAALCKDKRRPDDEREAEYVAHLTARPLAGEGLQAGGRLRQHARLQTPRPENSARATAAAAASTSTPSGRTSPAKARPAYKTVERLFAEYTPSVMSPPPRPRARGRPTTRRARVRRRRRVAILSSGSAPAGRPSPSQLHAKENPAMKRVLLLAVLAGVLAAAPARAANPVVVMETSMGTIKIELFEDKAPITVKNFLDYVDDKFYDGTDLPPGHASRPRKGLHDPGRRLRAKDHEGEEDQGPDQERVGQRPANKRGTLAMARTNDPDSATAQFFINVEDNELPRQERRRRRLLRLRQGHRGHGRGGQDQGRQDRLQGVHGRRAAEDATFQNVPEEDVTSCRVGDAGPHDRRTSHQEG